MKKILTTGVSMLIICLALSGCSMRRSDAGLLAGGVVGGVAGAALTGSTAGAVVGTIGGAFIGRHVAREGWSW